MRGLVMAHLLRNLEGKLGRPIHTLFDLVVGTSTGAILAMSIGVLKYTMDQCENIYTQLGHKVREVGGGGGRRRKDFERSCE